MDKESQYRLRSTRGRQPQQQQTQPKQTRPSNLPEQAQQRSEYTNPTAWQTFIGAPVSGLLSGLLTPEIKTRQQFLQYKDRLRRGLPRWRHKKSRNPFRHTASSWFKDICENKPLK